MTTFARTPSTTPSAGFSVELPVRPVSIAIGRSMIRRIVVFRSSDAEDAFLVAFTEIMTNALAEHVRLQISDPIVVEVDLGDYESVRVIDRGDGVCIDAPTWPASDASPRGGSSDNERGRGLVLDRAFVNRIAFDSSSEGTVAVLPLCGLGIIR